MNRQLYYTFLRIAGGGLAIPSRIRSKITRKFYLQKEPAHGARDARAIPDRTVGDTRTEHEQPGKLGSVGWQRGIDHHRARQLWSHGAGCEGYRHQRGDGRDADAQ